MSGVMYDSLADAISSSGDPGYGLSTQAYSIAYLKALYDREGAWKHINNFTADVTAFGQAVNVPTFQRLTAVDVLSSTGVFTYDNTSVLQGQILINKEKAVAVSLPETFILQAKVDLKMAFASEAGRAVADCFDHEFAKLIASLTTNSVSSAGTDLTEAILWNAIGTLVKNHVDVSNTNDLVWILPAATQYGVVHAALKNYTSSYKLQAPNTNADGSADIQPQLETVMGIPCFFRSDSELELSAASHYGGLFYRDAVGIAIQRMPAMRITPIPGTINQELLNWSLFGIATLKQSVACLLKTK